MCECKLTRREREVLALIALGLTDRQIGAELSVSTATVRTHVRNVLGKLEASNRAHAVAIAIRAGVIGGRDGGAPAMAPVRSRTKTRASVAGGVLQAKLGALRDGGLGDSDWRHLRPS